jgi:TldD protein
MAALAYRGGVPRLLFPAQVGKDYLAAQCAAADPLPRETLVQRAVEAAQRAGATYADARCTRTVIHRYGFGVPSIPYAMEIDGYGVRVLVNGYWGFSACPTDEVAEHADGIVRLAQAAVAQAKANATGATPRSVSMGNVPAAKGHWQTPVTLDPFAISIEEKGHTIAYWLDWALQQNVYIDGLPSYLNFMRQEQALATSDGSLVTQTRYESGGYIVVKSPKIRGSFSLNLQGLSPTAMGWELFASEAKIPEQLTTMLDRLQAAFALQMASRPLTVGRYTLVCDGSTMASLIASTLGVATQLDRALGYEANAGGTSFLNDPLGMVGHYQVASPTVTVTANRSAPFQLATVQWDAEGVVPTPFTLIKDGVLVDFQSTREQAAWLEPYYRARNSPIQSHGCAEAQDALCFPLQQRPNLALEAQSGAVTLDDLVANTGDGILIEGGQVVTTDFQGRTGLLVPGPEGTMRQIRNGRLGPVLAGGALQFDALDLFKHVGAVGGPTTSNVISHTPFDTSPTMLREAITGHLKGQPMQDASYSVRAAAATIANQPMIDPRRKI